MNTLTSLSFDGTQWGKLLQNVHENSQVDATHGLLVISEKSLEIKILKPNESAEMTVDLVAIMEISKRMLELNLGSEEVSKRKEIKAGLAHLETQIRSSIETHRYFGKDCFYTAVDFYTERSELETQLEETPDSKLKKEILQKSSEKLSLSEIHVIKEQVKSNFSLLFDLTAYQESFFDLARHNCSKTILCPLLSEVLLNLEKLDQVQLSGLKKLLFYRQYQEPTFFELLMTGEEANAIFDIILKSVSDKELNDDGDQKWQMLDFAYSTKRYDYLFFQVADLTSTDIQRVQNCFQTCQAALGSLKFSEYAQTNSERYVVWLDLRKKSSTTLKMGDAATLKACSERWKIAEEMRSHYASQHRGSTQHVDFSVIQLMHLKMCRGEEGINRPGKLREGIARTGGSWRHFFCPTKYLDKNVSLFMEWFNIGLIQCEQKELNPIIFATQVYQRLVTLHPFENGNGRVSHLLMGYV